MKTPFRALLMAAAAFAMLSLSSCVYDPYSYDYGSDGYYGNTMLVATSSSYWGYDPYRYCYFDYRRNCYYDPYLGGYYPVGHRPTPVYGCPHPRGWRPGHGVCPAPHNPGSHNLANYQNRLGQLQASNYAWRSQVRQNQQTQLAHMRTNQEAWRNRVQQAQPVTPTRQIARQGTPNPWFGGAGGSAPGTGRGFQGGGGGGGGTSTHGPNIQGGGAHGQGIQGQGGNHIQPGGRGRSTRQANLPVNTGYQQAAAQAQANAQAQAATRAQNQAAARSRVQAAQAQQSARIQAARDNQQSAGPSGRGGRSGRR